LTLSLIHDGPKNFPLHHPLLPVDAEHHPLPPVTGGRRQRHGNISVHWRYLHDQRNRRHGRPFQPVSGSWHVAIAADRISTVKVEDGPDQLSAVKVKEDGLVFV